MRARAFFAFLILCFLSVSPFTANADDKSDASAFTTNIGKQALAIIVDKGKAKEEKNAALEQLFVKNVDIDWIGKFVVGRYWRTASDEQKKQYLANYKAFLISHYTSNFAEFTNANFEVTKVIDDGNGGELVTMRIKRPQAEDIIVEYTIRKSQSDGLKVYDITVEGVSMISTQRSDFTSYISQNSFDALVSQLAARAKQTKEPNQ
jgi:phospholipid transport system substrate-binding protein